jgi:hypothetical protein
MSGGWVCFRNYEITWFRGPWTKGIERQRRQSWTSGINALQRLSRGQRPKDVHEAIMFLAAGKSMSTVMDSHEGEKSQRRASFFADLDRWQSLFFKFDGSLYNFQHAVKEIWVLHSRKIPE